LLGGDLFHDHRPSAATYFKASKIFNEHVFGQSCQMEFTTINYPQANYLSSNHKIKMPIFSIHGNHDDVVGLDLFSSLDQLNANSYINYFGKVTNLDKISVTPILMLKGSTKLAIYGIGHIKDMRFNLSFEFG
jgi:double-strand break repair protein MRE11